LENTHVVQTAMCIIHHDGSRPYLQQLVSKLAESGWLQIDDSAFQFYGEPCLADAGHADQYDVTVGLDRLGEHRQSGLSPNQRRLIRQVVQSLQRPIEQGVQLSSDTQKIVPPGWLVYELLDEPLLGIKVRCWKTAVET